MTALDRRGLPHIAVLPILHHWAYYLSQSVSTFSFSFSRLNYSQSQVSSSSAATASKLEILWCKFFSLGFLSFSGEFANSSVAS